MREEIQHTRARVPEPRPSHPSLPSPASPAAHPSPADATDTDLSDRYRLLVELIPDGVVVHQDGRVVYVNRSAARMVGASREALVGMPIMDFVHPDSVQVVGQRVAATTEPGVPSLPAPIQLLRIDGRPVPVESVTVLTSWKGRPAHQVIMRDLTAQQAAEQRFTAVVAALQEGVLLIDESGRVQAVNPAAEQLLDRPAAGLLGRDAGCLQLLDESGVPLPADRNPLVASPADGVPQQGRVVVVLRPDGSRRWLSATSRPLLPGGQPSAAVVSFSDITERRAAAERLLHTATHDPLTGLPNRSLLLEDLSRLLAGAGRRSGSLAVLSIDLDNFKVINDSVGHDVGDAALQVAARRLQRQVRDGDLVARFGGDEFVVVAGIAEPGDAEQLAARLLITLGRPMSGKLRGVPLNASIGVVVVLGGDERTPNELVRDADAAMYQAKARGRHRAELFDTALRERVVRRLQLESDLRDAVDSSALWVAYQPLVELATGRWVGAEALARWNHRERGPINPAEFVPIAEQSDLIHTLGHRTLVAACRDAVRLRSAAADFQISVNLSVRQLDDSRLVDDVQEVIERTGLSPSGLCLEVTESSLAVDEKLAGRTLTALRALGVSVAIDDFGTGYSSLARLRTLPVNELKIDRSFVTTLPSDRQARHIVAGIVALGHGLDMRVVAEGVETPEHAEILADLGCDLAQGYLYAKPVPIGEFHPPQLG